MQRNTVDVCIIDDDPQQRGLLFRQLVGERLTVVEASDGEAGLRQVRQHRPRVVICDLLLPGINGIELCRQVRADNALDGTYIVVLTACADRSPMHDALNAGADDYLHKPYDVEELRARLRNGLRVSRLQERLRQAALTDGLTGLWNHTQFRALLDREYARMRRYGGAVSLLMIDLDHFKAVNDTYGHETGNVVLEAMARHLLTMVRDTDIVARYGGEEFAIVGPATTLQDAAQLAERIRETVPERVRVADQPRLNVTASIGVACTTDARIHSVHDLVNLADQALYMGKRNGRNQVVRCDAVGNELPTLNIEHGEVDRLQKQVVSLNMQSKELCLQSVWALVQALEARDRHTAWHSRNTTFYAACLAEAVGMPDVLQAAISNAAMLHDLGKIGVPDEILQSQKPLTQEQAAVLRQVPLLTCKILEPLRIFETETLIIRHLRERFDGTGYPFSLSGATIPVGSRLLAVAEAFDALTSDRVYRARLSMSAAVKRIQSEAGGQFDPQFTALLERVANTQRERWQARIQRARAELEHWQAPITPMK
jgi:diguanylate cyclase (GGDEF)-like protein